MTIGTAKPTPEELQAAPHRFIGHLSVTDSYTAGTFAADADVALDALFETHDVVIAVGGSGLFLKAWTQGLDDIPKAGDDVRRMLQRLYDDEGIKSLQQRLEALDPIYFQTVDRQNPRRLIRALEVCVASGKPYSSFLSRPTKPLDYGLFKLGLAPERNELYRRIDARVDAMIKNGLVEEARALLSYRHLKPLQTVGYSELFDYFDGTLDLDTAIEKIKQHTRNYAKRQLTWFRKDQPNAWLKQFDLDETLKLLAQ